jgi:hypothetical protein
MAAIVLTESTVQVEAMESKTTLLTVANQDAFNLAAESVQVAKRMLKELEDQRKSENRVFDVKIGENNARYQPLSMKLKALIASLDGKMSEFTRRQLAEQAAERARQLKAAEEAAAKKAEEETLPWLTPEVPAVVLAPAPPPIKPTTVTTEGAVAMRENWKCEVENVDLVPEFVIHPKTKAKVFLFYVDQSALREVVRAGLHEIPGVKIWSEFSSTKVRS